jgi:hypothetical protein
MELYGGVAREAMRGIENGLKVKVRTNVKGNGQECPFHSDRGRSKRTTDFSPVLASSRLRTGSPLAMLIE